MKSVKLNMLFNMVRTVSSIVFPLITFPYTSRILGPHGTGLMNFAISFATYFITFATIGIPAIGTREVAQARDDRDELSARAQELLLMHLGATLVSCSVFIVSVFLREDLHRELPLFLIAGTSIVLSCLSVDWLYQGLEEYGYITARSLVFSTLSLVALLWLVRKPEHYVVCAAISVASSLGSAVLNFWNARSILLRRRSREWRFRRYFRSMGSSYGLSLVSSLYLGLDTVLLGFMSRPENVGYYAAAARFFTLTWSLISSLGATLMPRLAYYSETGDEERFQAMIDKSFAMTVMLCIPATAALMVLSHDIILVFAGDKFLPAVSCLNLTVPGLLFASLANILAWQVLFPRKLEGQVLKAVSITAVVSVTSNLILIRAYAHVGAAVSKLVSEIVATGALLVLARKACRIDIFPWKTTRRYLVGTVAMLGMVVLVRWAVHPRFARLALCIPLGAAVYFGVLAALRDELALTAIEGAKRKFGRVFSAARPG